MKLKTLRQVHPTYDADRWSDLEALSKGGKAFHAKMAKFLPQHPVEPPQIYMLRTEQAHYTSYVGSITNLYVSWLFAADFEVTPTVRGSDKAIDPDPFYSAFREDVGDETTLSNFVRERARECLTASKAYWIIELPSDEGRPAGDKAEWTERGLGRATLKPLSNCDVLDWAEDDLGELEWAIVHSYDVVRENWESERNTVVETWRIYDRENVTTYELRYQKNRTIPSPEREVPLKTPPQKHGFKRVPIVKMEVPVEICIGEQTHDPQLEHFRIDNALSWLIRRTCYAQPVFFLEDPEGTIPKMGTGYAIALGHQDKQGWTSPPTAPFDVLQKNAEAKRDEIYRVTQQMAQAVDNNAETVGRSADSKEIDAAATRIMLNAYGEYVASAIEETYELISEARDELDYEWNVEGFSGYDTATVASLIADSKAARDLGIPSQTFHQQVCLKVASAIFAGESQHIKEKIRKEILSAKYDVSSQTTEMQTIDKQIEGDKATEKIAAQGAIDAVKARPKPTVSKPV